MEWLLIEWPEGQRQPFQDWLSTAPEEAFLEKLVRLGKRRFPLEGDLRELQREIGRDHHEGRGWRGFHHHGVSCIAAQALLAAERARASP